MMISRVARVARTTSSRQKSRNLATSSQKRALNKKLLKGDSKDRPTPNGGRNTEPLETTAVPSGGGGGGGGAILPLMALAGVGVGGAYYNGLIPAEYLPSALQTSTTSDAANKQQEVIKVSKELKEVVEEVIQEEKKAVVVSELATETEEDPESSSTDTVQQIEVEEKDEGLSIAHPENGNRVDNDKIQTFYKAVNDGHAKQTALEVEAQQREAAVKATQYNESDETQVDPMSALTTAANAMAELQTATSLGNSKTLAAAKAAIRSDLDEEYFTNLETISPAELRIRVIQLATEMSDRTKWEAVRLKEFLSMKEKEVGDKYLEILQKQRLEFEALLFQKLREQEDLITRQANAALAAKEEVVQSMLKATTEALEQETKDILSSEIERISSELEIQYKNRLANDLGGMKVAHVTELEKHAAVLKSLQGKLTVLESTLELSHTYETGSKRAHRLSAAALALANKLEAGEGAAVELAALRGAVGVDGSVIASAVNTIPPRAERRVPTVADLQASFDKSYKVGRQAAMVPEGRGGLDGQLLGILFAKLSVPPSPDSVPASDEEGNVVDGILSSARMYVRLGNLEKALEQLNKLKGQTAHAMNDWKDTATDRVCTDRALKVIKLECALLNRDHGE